MKGIHILFSNLSKGFQWNCGNIPFYSNWLLAIGCEFRGAKRRIPRFFFDINYHSVLLSIAVVDAPDVFRSSCGGLFANLVRVADRIGEQVARCRATASGFREHDDAAPGSEDPSMDRRRPRPFIICQNSHRARKVYLISFDNCWRNRQREKGAKPKRNIAKTISIFVRDNGISPWYIFARFTFLCISYYVCNMREIAGRFAKITSILSPLLREKFL